MKKLIMAAVLVFPAFAFAAQPQHEEIQDSQSGVVHISRDAAGTTFVSGNLNETRDFNGQASLSESENVTAVLIPSMAQELNRKQAAESVRFGAISASGAATPDDLGKALMAKAEHQGASGYRITSVSNMTPYSGTATLYR
ncbi:DUF1471 domain-containing protein [Rahnella ecdela]|uniref:DUF1471 domain-containing protein n=1 Tax=Rahnella ecdela TaxID=2816250 RepID=A0ABS6L9T6_9GAMM|nr:DUF1471 domain-containing protein [Rahnella ecdela]MBU9843684.1 DUF1471 domain-containing protein [Rahnella ecdela]